MKILFYYKGAESFGIECLSSILKQAGHETELIFDPGFDDTFYFKAGIFRLLNVEKKLLAQARRFDPDLLAFSSTTNLYPYVREMARLLKRELRKPTIIGGIHATTLPDHVFQEDCFDILCVGEGEFALLELANRMEQGRDCSDIPNLWVKQKGMITRNRERPMITDINTLPLPDKDLFFHKGAFGRNVQVMFSRGCPYHCTFCVNSFHLKKDGAKAFRRRKVDSVIAELALYKRKYDPVYFNVIDDVFTTNRRWLEEFSEKYARDIGVKFTVNLHPDMVTEDTVRLLQKAGCRGVSMGIQSGNEAIRRSLLKRNETDAQIHTAARLLREAGIDLCAEYIFGLPFETKEQAWQSVTLNDAIRPSSTATFVFYPFPGTELADFSRANGLLDDEADAMIRDGAGSYHTTLFLKNPEKNFLLNVSYLLPLFARMPWTVRGGLLRQLCEMKSGWQHRLLGLVAIPFSNPYFFKEKLFNYLRMFRYLMVQSRPFGRAEKPRRAPPVGPLMPDSATPSSTR